MRKKTANTVQMSSLTVGGGNVTMTAITGYMQFSDRFANNDLVDYSIQDGNNWEHGEGTYNTGNILVRTTVYETLVGGVYTSGGSPITLSGNGAIVRATVPEQYLDQFLRLQDVPIVVASQNVGDGFRYPIGASGITLTISNWGATAGPLYGDIFHIYQAAAGITGVVVNPNGALIDGVGGNMTIDLANFAFTMKYTGASYGWVIF
jgi:hypothetical protein